jgi:WD40 repeat protein
MLKGRFDAIHSVRIGRGGEILSLAADTTAGSTTRIATGTRDKCIQVWTFDSNTQKLVSVHSSAFSEKKDIVPKALAFNDDLGHDLYIFGIFDGGL